MDNKKKFGIGLLIIGAILFLGKGAGLFSLLEQGTPYTAGWKTVTGTSNVGNIETGESFIQSATFLEGIFGAANLETKPILFAGSNDKWQKYTGMKTTETLEAERSVQIIMKEPVNKKNMRLAITSIKGGSQLGFYVTDNTGQKTYCKYTINPSNDGNYAAIATEYNTTDNNEQFFGFGTSIGEAIDPISTSKKTHPYCSVKTTEPLHIGIISTQIVAKLEEAYEITPKTIQINNTITNTITKEVQIYNNTGQQVTKVEITEAEKEKTLSTEQKIGIGSIIIGGILLLL